jgi:phospholipid/cholesterol/gamma-HCH transport system ATP-binding protein
VQADQPKIVVKDMDMAYGEVVIQHDINFAVNSGEIFIIMGGSGTGKSTLLKQMVGLKPPVRGDVYYDGTPFWGSDEEQRLSLMRRFGVLFQSGALWSSMTLRENVALPLRAYTKLSPVEIDELAAFKLALVGLAGFEEFHPSEISGGMRKRAGLARAMALDADILFFDEPSAGLDPLSAKRLDDLILELRDSLKATFVVVTHELASILAIGDNSILLDAEAQTVIASGNPHDLLKNCADERVQAFLTRGERGSQPPAETGVVA